MKILFPLLALPAFAFAAAAPEFNGSIERFDPAFDKLVAPDAKIEKLAGGFTWSEGPVWFDGGIVFSDAPKNTAHRWKEAMGIECQTGARLIVLMGLSDPAKRKSRVRKTTCRTRLPDERNL